jgi:hypothetical protein
MRQLQALLLHKTTSPWNLPRPSLPIHLSSLPKRDARGRLDDICWARSWEKAETPLSINAPVWKLASNLQSKFYPRNDLFKPKLCQV